MDKLEPLIRHRFWILFGLSIPLALTGYFLASGEMKAATTAKEEALKKTLDGVPKGVTEPNDKYAAGLKVINDRLQAENKVEVQKLWEAQRPRMDWPTVMVKNNYIPNEYRGEIEDAARRYYTRVYGDAVKRAWEKVQPVVDDPPPVGLEVTWPKKVLLMPETIPLHQFHDTLTPSTKQIWDAQEDIWLLELLFEGIARANRDATWIGDAPVRRIDTLFLTGGSGTPALQGAGGVGGAGAAFDSYEEEDDHGGGGMNAGASGLAGLAGMLSGGAGGVGGGSVSFNPAEEFGMPLPDPDAPTASGAGANAMESAFLAPGDEEESGFGAAGMAGMMLGGAGGMSGGYRYIGDPGTVEAAPYRERGFYISAIVMLPELPRIFADLSSSEWPIRVLRFQIGPNPYSDTGMGGYSQGGFAGRQGGMRGGSRDDDEDRPSEFGFGRGGFSGGFGAASGLSGLAGLVSSGGLGSAFGRGAMGGGASAVRLPYSMQGPYQHDPNWFANPDLVQVDFCGIITMYNPQTDDTVVPESDGSSAEDTPEAIAEREAAQEKLAAEAAAAEEAAAAAQAAAATEGAAGEAAESDPAAAAETDAAAPSGAEPAGESPRIDATNEKATGEGAAPAETNPE